MRNDRFSRFLLPTLVFVAALAGPPRGAIAQTPPDLVVTRTDGTTLRFLLSTIRRLGPGSSDLVVLLNSGARFSIPVATIRRIQIQPTTPASVGDPGADSPRSLRLLPAFPNPAGRSATLPFELATRTRVTLDVYAVTGQRVRTMTTGWLAPGTHDAVWDGTDDHGRRVSGGVYFYRLRGTELARRVTLMP